METQLQIWTDAKALAEVKKIYAPALSENEWKVFYGIGKSTGLNPFLREIWAVKYGNAPASIFIGRDGYRKVAQSNPAYDYHIADAVYANDSFTVEGGEAKHLYNVKDRGQLVGAYCIVQRKGSSKPVFTYVDLKEYTTGKSVWQSKPATMIKKVAEAQGLRMAFQALFAGTYEESEDWNAEKPATSAYQQAKADHIASASKKVVEAKKDPGANPSKVIVDDPVPTAAEVFDAEEVQVTTVQDEVGDIQIETKTDPRPEDLAKTIAELKTPREFSAMKTTLNKLISDGEITQTVYTDAIRLLQERSNKYWGTVQRDQADKDESNQPK